MSDRDRRTPDGNAKRQARMRRHRIKARSDAISTRPILERCDDLFRRTQKIAQVTKFVTRGKRALFREIAKCDVVCANCHRIRTHIKGEHMPLPEPRNDNQLGLEFSQNGKAAP